MVVLLLRMRRVCERHHGKRLRRVRVRVSDNGPGHLEHIGRGITRAHRKVCRVRTTRLIRRRTLIKAA